MNHAVRFLVDTDRTRSDGPVNRGDLRYLLANRGVIQIVLMQRKLYLSRFDALFHARCFSPCDDVDFVDVGICQRGFQYAVPGRSARAKYRYCPVIAWWPRKNSDRIIVHRKPDGRGGVEQREQNKRREQYRSNTRKFHAHDTTTDLNLLWSGVSLF